MDIRKYLGGRGGKVLREFPLRIHDLEDREEAVHKLRRRHKKYVWEGHLVARHSQEVGGEGAKATTRLCELRVIYPLEPPCLNL